jgi:hypothetical protein
MSTFDTEIRMNVHAMVFIDGENLAMRPTLHVGPDSASNLRQYDESAVNEGCPPRNRALTYLSSNERLRWR